MEKNFDVFSVASKFYRRNILNRINNTANLSDGVLFRYSTFQIDIAEHSRLWIDVTAHFVCSLNYFSNYAIKGLFQQSVRHSQWIFSGFGIFSRVASYLPQNLCGRGDHKFRDNICIQNNDLDAQRLAGFTFWQGQLVIAVSRA